MFHRRAACGVAAFISVCVIASSSFAGIVDVFRVGTGSNSATVQIDFENGNGYFIHYSWSAANYTSWNAMLDIDAALSTVSLQYDTYPFGDFLTGVSVGADTNYGQGDQWPVENYWHFWTRDSGSWAQSSVGASDHQVLNGSSDAWVFGSSIAPQPVPAPGALASAFAALIGSRRRRA